MNQGTCGKRPLEFFFLDEGFGTLDSQTLDRVLNAIDDLRDRGRMLGLISHVSAVRERLPRYLEVTPPTQFAGSSLTVVDA
ncbi:MAG: hypothetical protein HN348_03330 [Proteobacteria bacterium]|nr:hypothetical protein [Pseudomonadota bacterium]